MENASVSPRYVLDASAVLAFLRNESGSEFVESILDQSIISSVNVAEVLCKLTQYGMEPADAGRTFDSLQVPAQPFDADVARELCRLTVSLKDAARHLSLADRACLAQAIVSGVSAVTADRMWRELPAIVRIKLIR